LLARVNVVVTTMAALSTCDGPTRAFIANWASHLFIDEAHHIPAATWDDFRAGFGEKPILQFTATPFRQDGKTIDGKIIFNYPLKKAQEENYFKKITFLPVMEFDPTLVDESIAEAACEQLK